jgi:hypothetical protein
MKNKKPSIQREWVKTLLDIGFFRGSVLRFYDGIWEGKDVEKWSPPQAQGGGIQYQQEEHQPSHPCVLTKKMGPSGKAFETSALLLACSLASVTYLQISGTGHCRLVHLLPIGKLRSCIPSIKLPSILITLFVWNQYLEQR